MLILCTTLQLILNLAQASTLPILNDDISMLTEQSKIPAAQIFITKDVLHRLKTQEYRRFAHEFEKIEIKPVNAEGFELIGILINGTVAEPDFTLDVQPETNNQLVTLRNITLTGHGTANYTEEKVLDDWLSLHVDFHGHAALLKIEGNFTLQEKDGSFVPAMNFGNATGDITDFVITANDDSDWARILNGLFETMKDDVFKVIKPLLMSILDTPELARALEDQINKTVFKAGFPVHSQISQFNLTMTTNAIDPIKVVQNGQIMRMNMRFHPVDDYKEYSVCKDPNDLYKSSDFFYDGQLILGDCVLYSLMKAMIDNEYQHEMILPSNSYGLSSVSLTMKETKNGYVSYSQGSIKAKVRCFAKVDYSPPFTFEADANINMDITKLMDPTPSPDSIKKYPPPMGNFNINMKIDNIYNIDSSESPWVPAVVLEFVLDVAGKNLLNQQQKVAFPLPGICANYKDYDEFCVVNPQIAILNDYIMTVGDVSF